MEGSEFSGEGEDLYTRAWSGTVTTAAPLRLSLERTG